MTISNKTYDVLKRVCTIVLPAFITMYATISATWGLPYTEPIVATLGAINVFLGAVLGISTKAYLAVDEIDASEEDPEDDEIVEH